MSALGVLQSLVTWARQLYTFGFRGALNRQPGTFEMLVWELPVSQALASQAKALNFIGVFVEARGHKNLFMQSCGACGLRDHTFVRFCSCGSRLPRKLSHIVDRAVSAP